MHAKIVIALAFAVVMLVGASTSAAAETQCTGTITGVHDNIVIPPGAFCSVHAATVQGNVTGLEGAIFNVEDSTVGGTIQGNKAEVVHVRDTTVQGDIDITDSQVDDGNQRDAELYRNTVLGNIRISRMVGQILVLEQNVAGYVHISDNAITVEVPAPEAFDVRQNSVNRHMHVQRNGGLGDKLVTGNTVRQHLHCLQNDAPFVGGPNTAGSVLGQCT